MEKVIWLVKEEHEIRVEMNNTRMVRWMCNARPEDTISELKIMRECFQGRRLRWFGHLVSMEENVCLSKCSNFSKSSRVPRGRSKRTV